MADTISYNEASVSENTFVRLREMDLEAGLLGKLFGSGKTAAMNIAGLVIVFLVVCGVGYSLVKGFDGSMPFWQLITPIITLILGYLFGKK